MGTPEIIELLRANALLNLDELFYTVHGQMLDKGDSMFPTLATVSAVEASLPIGATACIAAHVDHTAFYIDVLLDEVHGADWEKSWKTTSVTEAEWAWLVANLESRYERMRAAIATREIWDDDFISVVLALIGHCAFHLGQIREAIATFR